MLICFNFWASPVHVKSQWQTWFAFVIKKLWKIPNESDKKLWPRFSPTNSLFSPWISVNKLSRWLLSLPLGVIKRFHVDRSKDLTWSFVTLVSWSLVALDIWGQCNFNGGRLDWTLDLSTVYSLYWTRRRTKQIQQAKFTFNSFLRQT